MKHYDLTGTVAHLLFQMTLLIQDHLLLFLNLFGFMIVLPCQRTKGYDFYQFVDFFGNERFALILRASMNPSLEWDSRSPSTTCFKSSDEGLNDIVFHDANVDSSASRFHSYSVNELRCLDKQTLHQILESASLAIESEDDLLRTLISLGSDYFEFWSDIEIISLPTKVFRFLLINYHLMT
jgi:hypothetical protein